MSKYFMCVKHNVLKLWLRLGFLANLIRIYFGVFLVVKVAGTTLDQRLSGVINSHPNGT